MDNEYTYQKTIPGARLTRDREAIVWSATLSVKDARNGLDPSGIDQLLAEDAVYEGQGVAGSIVGRSEIMAYFEERFSFLRNLSKERDTGKLLPARIDLPHAAAYPCLVFIAESKRQALWVVSPDDSGRIRRIDILTVAPRPDEAELEPDTDGVRGRGNCNGPVPNE